MSYSRQPLLSKQKEAELKLKMEPLWNQVPKLSGMDIAKALKFGIPGTTFEMLKPCYVYFYRQKLDLPLRAKARFKKGSLTLPQHRCKVSPETLNLMPPEDFVAKLNEALPPNEFNEAQRCFLIILYWTGLRASECYERVQNMPLGEGKVKNDFELLPDKIVIHLLRKKKKYHRKDDEPIFIPRVFPLAEEVVTYLQSKSWEHTFTGEPNKVKKKDTYNFPMKSHGVYQFELNHRPFNILKTTAGDWIKYALGEDFYCHWMRYNFVTNTTKTPDMKVSELVAKTQLTLSALEHYLLTPTRSQDELDAKKIKEMRQQGVIK
jgi:hypothetical protein